MAQETTRQLANKMYFVGRFAPQVLHEGQTSEIEAAIARGSNIVMIGAAPLGANAQPAGPNHTATTASDLTVRPDLPVSCGHTDSSGTPGPWRVTVGDQSYFGEEVAALYLAPQPVRPSPTADTLLSSGPTSTDPADRGSGLTLVACASTPKALASAVAHVPFSTGSEVPDWLVQSEGGTVAAGFYNYAWQVSSHIRFGASQPPPEDISDEEMAASPMEVASVTAVAAPAVAAPADNTTVAPAVADNTTVAAPAVADTTTIAAPAAADTTTTTTDGVDKMIAETMAGR